MAIDLMNSVENSNIGMSPRISFSHDVCPSDIVTVDRRRSDSLLMESNDFDFCTSDNSFEHDFSSSADELFSDGKLLPLQIKKQSLPSKPPTHPKKEKDITDNPSPSPCPCPSLSPSLSSSSSPSLSSSPSSSSSKSFWRFKRSSSCGNGYTRSLICSLPLLSRSNSTGSAPTPKRSSSSNSTKSHSPLKGTNAYTKSSSSSSSSSSSYPYSTSQKKYNNGVRINPVLNVPPPYISKGTVNLFGLGSFFTNGKDKNKKKKSDFT